jgi:uncharacterized protein (TIGR00730 family)
MPKPTPRPPKAYKNPEFLSSPDARAVRILSEFIEPLYRFRRNRIRDTIVFFGSARTKSKKAATHALRSIRAELKRGGGEASKSIRERLAAAEMDLTMSRYYEDAVELSRMLTSWTMRLKEPHRFVICSGGGPGIMEAANKGAALAGGKNIGLNISLPFEQNSNPYITDELNFEFHYFFMRKFWFMYLAKAFVMFPGGFGTLDELMEALTLLQTDKIKKKVTVVLYGREYWERIIDFRAMVHHRVISPEDLKLFSYKDTPQEAFEFLVDELRHNYAHEMEEI